MPTGANANMNKRQHERTPTNVPRVRRVAPLLDHVGLAFAQIEDEARLLHAVESPATTVWYELLRKSSNDEGICIVGRSYLIF